MGEGREREGGEVVTWAAPVKQGAAAFKSIVQTQCMNMSGLQLDNVMECAILTDFDGRSS